MRIKIILILKKLWERCISFQYDANYVATQLKHHSIQLVLWIYRKQSKTWFDSISRIKKFNFVTLSL